MGKVRVKTFGLEGEEQEKKKKEKQEKKKVKVPGLKGGEKITAVEVPVEEIVTEEAVEEKKKKGKFAKKRVKSKKYLSNASLIKKTNYPLNEAIEILKNIREKFPKFQEIKINNKKIVKEGLHSTASCGVVIAHYKTPLSEVLNWVRHMEKDEAKKNEEKNSCAIAVLKHSGEIVKTVFKWQYDSDKKKVWTTDLMDKLIKMLSRDIISGKFITALSREVLPLMEKDGSYNERIIVEQELERLLKRSYEHSKKEDKEFETLLAHLRDFYFPPVKLQNFLSFLNIIRFIAREVHYAD